MSDQPLVTTTQNFRRTLRAIGFVLGHGWDHEVWCDTETIENNFWIHFRHGDDPFEVQGPLTRSEYRVSPDAPTVDVGAFLRYWREACVEEAVESALEANAGRVKR